VATDTERYARIAQDSTGNLRDAWGRFSKGFQVVDDYQDNIQKSDRQISRGELESKLRDNVCEIVFVRRRPERAPVPPRAEIRRMLCSNSLGLLTSYNAKISLNFRYPKTGRRIDGVKHNIVCVWDILQQDYRNVSMDTCYIRQTIPADDTFWKYYKDVLFKMTAEQKMNFMDSIT
jgi:hypothetical protein|tara:strand:- start:5073 stop:5600 length:528 start_codon:yes stop_codon:yes gene_type:complete